MKWGQLGGAMRAAVSASPLAAAAAATTFIAPLALRSPSSAGMCVCVALVLGAVCVTQFE